MKLVKSRKNYTCDITSKEIKIGDLYKRLNSRTFGIFHFHKSCEDRDIKNFLMNEHVMPAMDEKERNSYPEVWDEEDQEIWAGVTDDCFN